MSSQPTDPDGADPDGADPDGADPDSADPAPVEGSAPMIAITGKATAEEVAALVAVLSAVGGGVPAAGRARSSAWSDPAWRLVGPSARGGGWQASGLPR
ncbi:MAG: acyl-CoA carboxylase subunit epsilon [Dermatophilaceae bacterium]